MMNIDQIAAFCALVATGVGWGCNSRHACDDVKLKAAFDPGAPSRFCFEYGSPMDEMVCEAAGGTSVSGCPGDDLIGTCEINQPGRQVTAFYYGGSVDGAKALCVSEHGTWMAQ